MLPEGDNSVLLKIELIPLPTQCHVMKVKMILTLNEQSSGAEVGPEGPEG